IPIKENALNE
ncbi:unnamed protein product, partial [Allacma fusca]